MALHLEKSVCTSLSEIALLLQTIGSEIFSLFPNIVLYLLFMYSPFFVISLLWALFCDVGLQRKIYTHITPLLARDVTCQSHPMRP